MFPIVIVRQYEKLVVLRWGRYVGTRQIDRGPVEK